MRESTSDFSDAESSVESAFDDAGGDGDEDDADDDEELEHDDVEEGSADLIELRLMGSLLELM